jgi:trimethylamine---corrinoid protein Co-methyltransferase
MWNQVWRAYRVPHSNGSPGYVSSKVMDYQAGYEKALAALIAALSGANYILLHLGVSSEITAHPVQAILDDDVAAMIGRFVEGEDVREETLALELIEEVGPLPGQYLDKTHTRDWWRKGQVMTKAADRMSYPEWLGSGKKTALDYARERMQKILETHHPILLTPAQDAEIERILNDARQYYATHP